MQWKDLDAVLNPHSPPTPAPRVDHLGASTYIERGWSLMSAGEAHGAEVALREALRLSPLNLEAGALLAWASAHQGRTAAAIGLLDRIHQIDPDNPLGSVVRGFLLLKNGEPRDAIHYFREAAGAEGGDRRTLLFAVLYEGLALRDLGSLEDASAAIRKALVLGPNFLEAALELGRTLVLQSRVEEAVRVWREAAASNRFSPWGKRCSEAAAKYEALYPADSTA